MNIVLYSREVLRTNHRSKNNRLFYLAIGSTLILLFYALYVLPHYSACFSLPNSNNSLGLSFGYGIRTATQFFETRTEEQRFCYAHFICIWDNIFTLVYTITHTLWLIFLFNVGDFFSHYHCSTCPQIGLKITLSLRWLTPIIILTTYQNR